MACTNGSRASTSSAMGMAEPGGLARPGLRLSHDVVAIQQRVDDQLLDRGGGLVAHLVQRALYGRRDEDGTERRFARRRALGRRGGSAHAPAARGIPAGTLRCGCTFCSLPRPLPPRRRLGGLADGSSGGSARAAARCGFCPAGRGPVCLRRFGRPAPPGLALRRRLLRGNRRGFARGRRGGFLGET